MEAIEGSPSASRVQHRLEATEDEAQQTRGAAPTPSPRQQARSEVCMPTREPVEHFTVEGSHPRLTDVVPGTTAQKWYRYLLRELEACGALTKRGAAWYGRRSDIERALTEPPPSTKRTKARSR